MARRFGPWAVVAALVAAAGAPALELATGSPLPYSLILTALAVGVWAWLRPARPQVGWTRGSLRAHGAAFLYPFGVMVPLGVLALLGDAVPEGDGAAALAADWGLMFAATWPGVLLTEEGLYRGALWGLGLRAGWSARRTLVFTSLAFLAWHVAVPLIEEPFRLSAAQLPVYYANVLLLGLAWGLIRHGSGSLLVACTAHASWNASAYVMFGFGTRAGALGLSDPSLWGPERGWGGVVLNLAVVLVAWWRWGPRKG